MLAVYIRSYVGIRRRDDEFALHIMDPGFLVFLLLAKTADHGRLEAVA